jgi:opacity protein-like surface antigen
MDGKINYLAIHIIGEFMREKVARSLAVFVFVVSVAIFPFNTAWAQIGGYVGVFGGYTLSPDMSWNDRDFSSDLAVQSVGVFGIKVGGTHPSAKFFSFELEYSYFSHDVDRTVLATAGSDYAAIEGSVKFHNLMFNAIVKYPEGKFHPYLGAGLGASYVDVSLTSTSRSGGVNYSKTSSTDDALVAWQILIGLEADLTNSVSLDIGYRYFAAQPQDYHVYYGNNYNYYHNNDYDHTDDGPTVDYKTGIVTLGLKYRF